jgi:hypothetical protein
MADRDIAARVLQRFTAGKKVPVWNREKEWRTRVDPKTLKEHPSEYQRLSPVDLEEPRKRLPPKGYPTKVDKPDAPDRPDWPRRPRVPRDPLPAPKKRRKPVPPPKPVPYLKLPKPVPPIRVPEPPKPRKRMVMRVAARYLRLMNFSAPKAWSKQVILR